MSDEVVEISAELVRESDKAFLLNDGDGERWVPKSKVNWIGKALWEMPEWLAKDKGFI